jgi:hypothetical protein
VGETTTHNTRKQQNNIKKLLGQGQISCLEELGICGVHPVPVCVRPSDAPPPVRIRKLRQGLLVRVLKDTKQG